MKFDILQLYDIWEKYGFEIMVGAAILFIIVFALFRRGKGTWSDSYFYMGDLSKLLTNDAPKQQGKDSRGEIICRQILERKFGKKFNKDRPNFLRNPVTGGDRNLELDCYNPELGLALEYNGRQHYDFVPHFHKNKEAFMNQKYRDEMKRTKCKEAGIALIEVPYTVKENELESFIDRELYKFGFVEVDD